MMEQKDSQSDITTLSSSGNVPFKKCVSVPRIKPSTSQLSMDSISMAGTQPDYPLDLYTFEDQNLHNEAFSILFEFYRNQHFSDIEIHVGNRVLHCHRIVLACFSSYFRSMFMSDMAECHKPVITIEDIDENAFSSLIDFAYTAKITMSVENVQTLLYACSILQIESVTKACCGFMAIHLHPTNCVGVRNFAELHGLCELVAESERYMINNFADIVACEDYSQLNISAFLKIIESDNLVVRSEEIVYEAAMKWIKSNIDENRKHLADIMSRIRLSLLPPAYLVEIVGNEELLKKDLECRDLMDEAKNYQMFLANVIPEYKLGCRMRPRKSYAGIDTCYLFL